MDKIRYNNELFAEFLDEMPQGIIWLRPVWSTTQQTIVDFEYAYINDEGIRYLNIDRHLIPGLLLSSSPTVTENLRKKFFEEMVAIYKTGKKLESKIYNSALNKYAKVLCFKFRGGILNVVQDVTEDNQIIQELEKEKTFSNSILEHSPTGISVTEVIRDKNGTIVDGRTIIANDQAVELAQLPREVYLSKTITELDPDFLKNPNYQQALHTLKTGEPFHTQYYYEPTCRWIELSVARMDDDHLINILTDITSIKQSQIELECSLEELKRTNENLEEFAYAASHDMKEPIRKVRFYADLLNLQLQGRLSEDEQRALERIENATRRMTLLVDDLLLFSQVTCQTTLEELVDLNVKVRLVLEDLELLIREKQAVITVGELPVVKGHRRQLQQLLSNLITNALKYSKPGEAPRVDIRSRILSGSETGLKLKPDEMNRAYHLIEVEDKGIGFEQKDAERIFNVFTRLRDDEENKGTGVGLAIASKVVRNHGGFIKAESAPNVGTTFKVYLPVYEETKDPPPGSNVDPKPSE
jgi:signal transduction histidine kinase